LGILLFSNRAKFFPKKKSSNHPMKSRDINPFLTISAHCVVSNYEEGLNVTMLTDALFELSLLLLLYFDDTFLMCEEILCSSLSFQSKAAALEI